jgi:hypothetical protein
LHWVALEARMAERIPKILSEAFKQAIVVCYDWSGDDKEAARGRCSVGSESRTRSPHPESLGRVVSSFSDEMPSEIVASLLRLPYNACDSVSSDRSYANGARRLLDFITVKCEMHKGSH